MQHYPKEKPSSERGKERQGQHNQQELDGMKIMKDRLDFLPLHQFLLNFHTITVSVNQIEVFRPHHIIGIMVKIYQDRACKKDAYRQKAPGRKINCRRGQD
jgi:hypothetical protein